MKKIKIFIVDGLIEEVLASDGLDDIEVEIVDYDKNYCSSKALDEEYSEEGLFHHGNYYMVHPGYNED